MFFLDIEDADDLALCESDMLDLEEEDFREAALSLQGMDDFMEDKEGVFSRPSGVILSTGTGGISFGAPAAISTWTPHIFHKDAVDGPSAFKNLLNYAKKINTTNVCCLSHGTCVCTVSKV